MLLTSLLLSVKNVRVANDPWGDGRTLEWAIQSPPLYYNFAQTPLVRGLDSVWIEKQEGNKSGITPAVPVQDIHMPHGSIIPFMMSFGLFIAGFGAMYRLETAWGLPVLIFGLTLDVCCNGCTFSKRRLRLLCSERRNFRRYKT